MKETLREKINKDNGKYYQIDNRVLNIKEIAGYIFLIFSLLIYLLVGKASFQHSWLGWLFFIVGLIFLYFGVKQNESG